MRNRENFLAYTACRKVHRVSARRWPYTMGVSRRAARAIGGYDGINRRDRDGPVQAPILPGAYENCPCLENPSFPPCACYFPLVLACWSGQSPKCLLPIPPGNLGRKKPPRRGGRRAITWIAVCLRGSTRAIPGRGGGRAGGRGDNGALRRRADTVLGCAG